MKYLMVLSLFLASLCAGMPSHAQEILGIFKKPMPKIELLPEAEFIEKTKVYEEVPAGVREFSYKIRVPKDWSKGDEVSLGALSVSKKIASNLAKYYGPVTLGIRHEMLVQAVGIEYQMTAKYWLMKYLLENSYSVQGITVHDSKKAEALYVFVNDKNVSYVTRAIAQINGKNLIFIQHFLPLEEWHDNKIMQAQVLQSFKLKNVSDKSIEERKEHKFLDIAEFAYPASWKIKVPTVNSVDRMSAELLNLEVLDFGSKKKNILNGTMNLELVSIFATKGIDAEIDLHRQRLAERGLFVREELEDHTEFVFDDPEKIAETHVFKIIDKNRTVQEYEFWLSITANGDYYYFTTLLTPTREAGFFKWSRNTQAYKEVAKNFKAQPEAQAVILE